jgi:two-component system sensor histidine kinase UhpB
MLVQLQELKGRRRARRSVDLGLAELQAEAREILADVRRLLYDLRGQAGLEEDFVLALKRSLLPRFEQRFGVTIRLKVNADWPSTLRPEAALNLYRIVQEALTNAIRHGGAKSMEVELRTDRHRRLVLLVQDDGAGVADSVPAGFGVLGMRERAALLGGELRLQKSQRGMVVRATFPEQLAS